jgi:hypothetical protein
MAAECIANQVWASPLVSKVMGARCCAGDNAPITLGQQHPVQVERQAALGQQGYWERFRATDDIY